MDTRHYVYLLRCADGSLYTGMTPDIARRLRQHVWRLPGCAKYTRSHPVTALALLLTTDTATTARQLEARSSQTTSPTRKNRQTPERLPVSLCLWFSAGRAAPDSGARAWRRR